MSAPTWKYIISLHLSTASTGGDSNIERGSVGPSETPSQTSWDGLAESQSLHHQETEVGEGSSGSQDETQDRKMRAQPQILC